MKDLSDKISKEIGRKIRIRRKNLGLSLENLADSLQCSVQTINKYEKAITRVPSPALFELSKVLKTSLSYFFEDVDLEAANTTDAKAKDTLDLKDLALNVLIVEDNISDELLIKRAIENNNFNVRLFILRESDQFLNFIRGKIENTPFKMPDLILLDIRLHSISGIELLKMIKKDPNTKFIPVIIFTNSYDLNTLRAAYENGASAYINKSFNTNETIKILQTTIDYWSNCVILPKAHQTSLPLAS